MKRESNFGNSVHKDSKRSDRIIYIVLLFIAGYFTVSALLHSDADWSGLLAFHTVFISIIIQAFPFMLVGVVLSSVLHIFVPDEMLIKIFPMKRGLGFVTALLAGLLFPVCECAIVPVIKQLVKKGVPVPVALTFMLAAPIINPISIVSTLYAFPGQPEIALIRVGLGLFTALAIGLVFLVFSGNTAILLENAHSECCQCHNHRHEHAAVPLHEKVRNVFYHTGEEFFGVGKYLIVGAFIAAMTQRLIPQSFFTGLSVYPVLAMLLMLLFAFCFSACSTSDAFIARSFAGRFSLGAVMGFMVFGPMMDIKNMMMLFEGFKKSFVFKLIAVVFAVNFFVLSLAANLFL